MKMFYTTRSEFVEVCAVYQDRTAMIFDPYIASKTGPSGAWVIVKLSKLIPEDYVNREGKFESKTEKNKLKARLALHNAEWETTDGNLLQMLKMLLNMKGILLEKNMLLIPQILQII